MALKFKVQARKNPQKPNDPPKYYAEKVYQGTASFKKIVSYMNFGTTASRTDAITVISAFLEAVESQLLDGQIIEFGELGYLMLSIQSKGSDNPEDVGVENCVRPRIHFRPKPELKEILSKMEFEKVTTKRRIH